MRTYSPAHQPSSEFYRSSVEILEAAGVEYLVGGAFALGTYTGIERDTKDFDLMIRPADMDRALEAFRAEGLRGDYTFTHWLAKIHRGEYFIDIIFRAGNGLGEVDDEWFANSRSAEVFGKEMPICPPEEIIWQKAYIMERERFDGADIQHLLRSCAREMDWDRLLRRFGEDWRVLLSHLTLFGFIYSSERHAIPFRVMKELLDKALTETMNPSENDRLCRGTLLSRGQYLPDVERWDYQDAREQERVKMTPGELRAWTNAIDQAQRPSEDSQCLMTSQDD